MKQRIQTSAFVSAGLYFLSNSFGSFAIGVIVAFLACLVGFQCFISLILDRVDVN
jgi:hypothetical protein